MTSTRIVLVVSEMTVDSEVDVVCTSWAEVDFDEDLDVDEDLDDDAVVDFALDTTDDGEGVEDTSVSVEAATAGEELGKVRVTRTQDRLMEGACVGVEDKKKNVRYGTYGLGEKSTGMNDETHHQISQSQGIIRSFHQLFSLTNHEVTHCWVGKLCTKEIKI